jgi:hypothetical protein
MEVPMMTTDPLRKIVILSILLMLSACSLFRSLPDDSAGWVDWDGRGGWSETSEGRSALAEEGAGIALSAPADASMEDEAKSFAEEPPAFQNAPLRAGSVDDNAQWDDYLLYRLQFREWGIPVDDLEVSGRHVIKVVNQRQVPVLGARVEVFDPSGEQVFQATSGADGTIYFHPHINGFQAQGTFEVVVSKEDAETRTTISDEEYEHELVLDARSSGEPIRLDVHFLIDATGSMSDEIQQLKDNMISVAERIGSMQSNPDVRYGMTIYRDREDLFVSRTFDFTPDVTTFTDALREVNAEGGGDYPESLNEGFHQALFLPEWRVEETVSLLFLIADAPPHLDYAQDYRYAQDVLEAVEAGIKIFPLASSGLDDQGEYIFRQLAQISGGKFLFLTYGPGGAPGDDTTHHVDDYSVLSLDDLVVRLVEEQLTFLTNPTQ